MRTFCAAILACACLLAPWTASLAAPSVTLDGTGDLMIRADNAVAPASSELSRSSLPVAGPVDANSYRVGPGDVLQLNYSGRVSRTVSLTIGPEGTTFIPGWGVLRLGGLSLAEARRFVDQQITARLVGIQLDLTLIRVRMVRIYLTGEVGSPGAIEIVATSRVSGALPEPAVTPGLSW